MAKTGFTSVAVKIKAVGVGGGGCNAINRMVRADIQGVDFIAVNTDIQALMMNEAPTRIQIGEKTSGGLGVGGDPGRGHQSAEENLDELKQAVSGANMVFIAAGMGGGTGTGASPVIARIARESGALTIAIVTKPFNFEMARRMQIAEEGINELTEEVDATIVIPNERLLGITGDKVTVDTPTVEGARVTATAQGEGKGRKVIVLKYKPKVRYRKKTGHRQLYTRLAIDDIVGPEAAAGEPTRKTPRRKKEVTENGA